MVNTDNFLSVSHLNISFNGNTVIKDLSFNIKKGTLTSFLGPSGSGKTTVLRAIAGLNQAFAGQITLDGQDITNLAPNQRNIGMIFQSYALFPNLTVFDNIAYGLRVQKKPKTEIEKAVTDMLAIIGLTDRRDYYPANLSGGQRQRVAIARSMVLEPKLLLLDEPLSALDAKTRVELRNQIKRYQQELGITMIFVTHDQTEAMAISDDVLIMSLGELEQQGSAMEIYTNPKTMFVADFIGNHNVLAATDLAMLGLGADQPDGQYIIRPELLEHVMPANLNGYAPIEGQVVEMAVLGNRIEYSLKTATGHVVKAECMNQNINFTLNDEIKVYLKVAEIKKVG